MTKITKEEITLEGLKDMWLRGEIDEVSEGIDCDGCKVVITPIYNGFCADTYQKNGWIRTNAYECDVDYEGCIEDFEWTSTEKYEKVK